MFVRSKIFLSARDKHETNLLLEISTQGSRSSNSTHNISRSTVSVISRLKCQFTEISMELNLDAPRARTKRLYLVFQI